jgi:hypothetical protein
LKSLKPIKPEPTKTPDAYYISRVGSGYAIFKNGIKVSEEDVLDIALAKLTVMIKAGLNL